MQLRRQPVSYSHQTMCSFSDSKLSVHHPPPQLHLLVRSRRVRLLVVRQEGPGHDLRLQRQIVRQSLESSFLGLWLTLPPSCSAACSCSPDQCSCASCDMKTSAKAEGTTCSCGGNACVSSLHLRCDSAGADPSPYPSAARRAPARLASARVATAARRTPRPSRARAPVAHLGKLSARFESHSFAC